MHTKYIVYIVYGKSIYIVYSKYIYSSIWVRTIVDKGKISIIFHLENRSVDEYDIIMKQNGHKTDINR